MLRSLWIAKTGMEGQQAKLDAISNNLANVGTNGFKRAGINFEDLMYQNLRPAGSATSEQSQLPTGLQVGLGVKVGSTTRNFGQGSLQQTGNNFDIAVKGQGFFQVQMPDGTTAYTRDGAFQVDANGALVTNAGNAVLPGITVPAAALGVSIADNGTVSATLANQPAPQVLGTLQLASFINPAGLEPRGGNLYSETAASGTPNAGAPGSGGLGTLLQGFVEGSNVNVVEELVSMIATQRAYELNSKAIQSSDQMLQRLSQL
ncbi:flagellar component of cell-distal portion of basal-body rod [Rubrivivax sp. A210]|uniref:flagellar basal-body rod protein FlgG n=1 Tax=Rubrivivax sp. A210 TaxID=2772301 RepID=UPI0019197CE0|nr:flagellar basal-body rod protein FlgG [Rubrivivax sp. A210]CAD5374744.1 flagellar component of cell-distal portion of basal-body rod [Rubrivivax sp. A210]